jgi:hypothetical protein
MQPLPAKWRVRSDTWRQLSEAYAAHLDLWVSGASGCGKTSLVLDFFEGKPHTFVSGSNFENLKQIIKHLCSVLLGTKPKSIDLAQLVWMLQQQQVEHYLVIDKVELFVRTHPDFITDLLQVREASCLSLQFCLVSEASCLGSPGTLTFMPAEIEVAPYSKEDSKAILKTLHREMPASLFDSCFKQVEQRLSLETRQISAYKFVFSQLHSSLTGQAGRPLSSLVKAAHDLLGQRRVVLSKSLQSPLVRLNRQCKLLLAAAFLCSRTPASADVKVFKNIAKKDRTKAQLVAPKYFDVERMLAIFDVLASLHSSQRHSLELLASVRSLQEQGLLGCKGTDALTQKLICLIDLEQFKQLCEALEIRASDYLLKA